MYKVTVIIISIFFTIAVFCDHEPPQNYYKNCNELDGVELKAALYTIISGHKVFPYYSNEEIGTADILKRVDEDPDNPGNVICFYSGFSYPKNWQDIGRNKDYSKVGTELDNTWNREHVWSKSHGFPDHKRDIAYSDVHNLRPEDRTVNSSKGDKDFDWGGFPEDEAPGCFTDFDSWEAPDRVKGDIARCIFYMATRYEGIDTPYDLEIIDQTKTDGAFYGKISTLLEWHKLDPPDEYEKRRNNLIYTEFQKNRNPFIDHPEFAFSIWGEPQYKPRLTTSQSDLYFTVVQGSYPQLQNTCITVVNHNYADLGITIEAINQIFSINDHGSYLSLPVENNYLNEMISIKVTPREIGSFVSCLCFYPYKSEDFVQLHARILPDNGLWLINQDFEESMGEFTSDVLKGNPRYGWYQSSWDNDQFACLRGSYDDFYPREVLLVSPPLKDISQFSRLLLNFNSARNEIKASDQLQVFITNELFESGIPETAYQLSPNLSKGNYEWKNSSWLEFDPVSIDQKTVYLVFRYYFDGNELGQETWEIDDIKLYGIYK